MLQKAFVVTFVSLCWAVPASASGDGFVEYADDMVDEMLRSDGQRYAKTRSFVVVEEKTRAISVRKKNQAGEEQTVVVQVPESGVDPAARLKVEFDVNSASLRPSAYPLLAELSKALSDERVVEHNVCIKGHTDSDGGEAYNLQLSYARATTVLNYLQGAIKIAPEKLYIFGYGENMPLKPNNSPWNKQLNRRVEVSLNCREIE